MFKKKKNQDDVNVENTETETVQFDKNIKTLWIYTTLFCAFALVLIIVSSVIQSKVNSKAEYYQEQFENAQTSGQSTIKNIQDENEALKHDIEMYKAENERLTTENETDELLLSNAAALIENAEALLRAQKEMYTGSYSNARNIIKTVDKSVLSEVMQELYNSMYEQLGL